MSNENGSKAKGSTPTSLYGATGKPIQGTVIEVWSKTVKFDHDEFQNMAWKVLYRHDGQLCQAWFNTYQETNEDGTKTPVYIGEKTSLEKNSGTVESEEKFQAKAAAKGYTKADASNWPPACNGENVEAPTTADGLELE